MSPAGTRIFILTVCTALLLGACQAAAPAAPTPTQVSRPSDTPIPPSPTPPLPTLTPTLTPIPTAQPCTQTRGEVKIQQLNTNLLPYSLDFRVYVPPCYDNALKGGYPVLYMIHGQGFNDDQWVRLGIAEAADRVIAEGLTRPFLIVMPRENYFLEDFLKSKFGGGLMGALIPWVDRNYNTCTLRECRAIGGLSRGASWAMHLALTQWEKFGSVGAHSYPSMDYDYNLIPSLVRTIPEGKFPRIYIDIGTLDTWISTDITFQQRLVSFHIPHEFHLNPGLHDEEYWKAHVEEYLRWYAIPWKKPAKEMP